MSLTYHICQGGLTAVLLARAITDPIITVADDYTIGPLQDVDALNPRARNAFYRDIFRQLRYRGSVFPASPAKITRQLASACADAEAFVLWVDERAATQLMRLRVGWLLHHHRFTGRIFDVRCPLMGASVSAHIRCPLPLHSETGIRTQLAEREALPPPALSTLAGDWASLKSQPCQGIRLYQANRWQHLAETHYDDTLLTLVARHNGSFDELVSRAVTLTGQSTQLCLWRYALFVRAGTLRLIPDRVGKPVTAVLSMA